jgi:hypothetical protein
VFSYCGCGAFVRSVSTLKEETLCNKCNCIAGWGRGWVAAIMCPKLLNKEHEIYAAKAGSSIKVFVALYEGCVFI